MIPRRLIALLVYALPVLLVSFAVLMGGFSLASATGDSLGAGVLWWIGMASLMLLAADLVLLVAALGVNHLAQSEDEQDGDA